MESSAGGDEKKDIMKNNKKLNSIATMSKKELQEVNGGSMYLLKRFPDIFPEGIPALKCSVSSVVSNPEMIGMNAALNLGRIAGRIGYWTKG